MKLHISPETAEAMRPSGWSEERRVDIQAARLMLEGLGFFIGPVAEAILTNLMGLEIEFADRHWAHFDADQTDRIYANRKDPYLSQLVGEPLCRIGATCLADIFVTETGRIIVLDIEWFAMSFVKNIDAFLDSMMTTPPFKSWQVVEIPLEQRPSPFDKP
jgi:hypothetical protein